jgi:D-alanyl-lipoteichoic acid acyltransferase DltB (MBOAT superfamily)
MFFTSYEFLFLFLPVAFVGFQVLLRRGYPALAEGWLILLSLLFYWSLDRYQVVALLASVVVNYAIGLLSYRYKQTRPRAAFFALWSGICFNVLFLLSFKYVGAWFEISWPISIPLGISFFSLQQIAYQVSVYSEDLPRQPFHRHLLFVCFFPYVVAGPVLLANEAFPQLEKLSWQRSLQLLLPALTLFSLGLFKKVVLADSVSSHVETVFAAANDGTALSAVDAWCGALLYPLQLYFDFSGYSDMAAGIAALFGIRLPRNFHSPYKATSIMEFWRRWHITVTRFFTTFIYVQLVMKFMRFAIARRIAGVSRFALTVLVPMIVTFLLIGVWHGAGANFIAFGLLMGIALSVNHVWVRQQYPAPPMGTGWLLTMLVVIIGMIFDRSADMTSAASVLQSMIGLGGGAGVLDGPTVAVWLVALGAIALFGPNTHEIMADYAVVLEEAWDDASARRGYFRWSPGSGGLAVASALFCISVVLIPRAGDFIYYRF